MELFVKYTYIYNFIAKYFRFLNEPDNIEEYSSSESEDSEYDSEDYVDE